MISSTHRGQIHLPHSSKLFVKRTASLVFLLMFIFVEQMYSQKISDESIHQLLMTGMDLSGKQKYSAAKKIFDRCIAEFPNHPAGYLCKAILYDVLSQDFETPVPEPEFTKLLESAQHLSEEMSGKNKNSWEALCYLGLTHSYIAYHKFREGSNWFSGLQHGLTASGYLQDCIDMNPKAYDAYTGIGTYKYWKSRKMFFLTWTPFVSDEREAGIQMLRKAEQYAAYTNYAATNALVWIYIEEKRYTEAENCARTGLKKFPDNRLFLWGLASAAERQKHWNAARETYQTILKSLDDEVSERRYIEIQAHAKIATTSNELKDYKTALQECDWVLAHANFDTSGFTNDGAARIKRRIKEVKELREKLR